MVSWQSAAAIVKSIFNSIFHTIPHEKERHARKGRLGMPFLCLTNDGTPLNLQFSGQSWPWTLSSFLEVILNHVLQVLRDPGFNFSEDMGHSIIGREYLDICCMGSKTPCWIDYRPTNIAKS